MLYLVELGPIEQEIALQAMRTNRPLPRNIEEAPELQTGLQLYLQAFFDLDSERSHSMGFTRIPSSKIRAYAREFDFDDEQQDALEFYVSQMDHANIKRLQAKEKAQNG